jgi:hypothetical protein
MQVQERPQQSAVLRDVDGQKGFALSELVDVMGSASVVAESM